MTKTVRELPYDFSDKCSLSAALEVVGERWAFLILRGAFNGVRHFEEFQSALGIARNILADRLARFVDRGVMERRPMPDDRRRIEYRLTDKGHALAPTFVALRQWGERWETGVPAQPVLVDVQDGQPVREVTLQSHDGRVLGRGDMRWAVEEGDEPG